MTYQKKYDLSTFTAILIGFAILAFAIFTTSNHFAAFLDTQSIMIVLLGTFFVTSACFSISEVLSSFPNIYEIIFFKIQPLHEIARASLRHAEFARKSNPMKLEDKLVKEKNETLLVKGLILLNQNEKIDTIDKILKQEILTYIEEKENIVSIVRKAAEIAPAMGLIGTLVGLVQMLGSLDDPSNLGPSMAISLLTTFYGAMLSYMFFFPIASKIEHNTRNEITAANIFLETVISISKNENPRYLENTLNSLLSSAIKINYFA